MQAKRKRVRAPLATSSESTEDHLERIAELIERKGYARVTDVALELDLTRSSVSNMVRRLAKRGFLNYEKYRGFTLTERGRAVANHIRVRHQILTEMLQLLGLSPETVEDEVEAIEHHLKPETLQAFSKLVRFWHAHPEQLESFFRSSRALLRSRARCIRAMLERPALMDAWKTIERQFRSDCMRLDPQKILESKRVFHRKLTGRPQAEPLRRFDGMREKEAAIRGGDGPGRNRKSKPPRGLILL